MNYLNSIYYIYANMDKNSKFLLTMIILIIILLFLILIVSLIQQKIERKKYEKSRQNIVKTRHINKNVNYDVEEEKQEPLKKEEIKEEVQINSTKPEEEIEELEIFEDEVDDEIENIKKMIENTLEQEPIRLNKFEEEQEKTAIISYDELVKKAGAKKIVYKKEDKKETVKSTFKPSQILSPIYGVQKEKKEVDPVLKSFDEIENMKFRLTSTPEEEMQNDVEFLNNLKKFRSSLE